MSFLRKVGEEQHRNFSFLLSAVPGHPYRAAPVHQERCVFKIYKVKKNSVVNERSLSPQNSLKQKETTNKKSPPEILITKLSPVRVSTSSLKFGKLAKSAKKKIYLSFFSVKSLRYKSCKEKKKKLQLFILVKTSNSKKSVSE